MHKVMTQEKILSDILKVEEKEHVNDLYIEEIPIWNILKYRLRGYHNVEMGINDITNHKRKRKKNLLQKINNLRRSFLNLSSLINLKHKISYCFVGFTRLEKINDVMIDKFIDPIIYECGFDDNEYIYMNNESVHPSNRCKDHNIFNTDFINTTSLLLTTFVFPFLYIRNRKTYKHLKNLIQKYYTKNRKAILYLYIKPSIIYIQHLLYIWLFKRIGVKSVIGVARPTFFPQALAAKKLGIKVIELQHGITHGPTTLYSGVYNSKVDPDYFCTFGESCPPNVFNIDESRVINIGFALNSYLKKIIGDKKYGNNCILVISEPETSELILATVLKLAKSYPDIEFHIRRHPQEVYSEVQKERIRVTTNIKDVSSSVCSQIAIMPYNYILGDNSSVLFEALSVGKKVARLNCEGLISYGYLREKEDGFYYLNDVNDFSLFLKSNFKNRKLSKIYSDFNVELFNNIISLSK